MYPIVPLPDIRAAQMEEVLAHEREAWRVELDWDFSATTALILRSVAARAFAGFAALHGRRVVAYSYFVPDRDRARLGSVHALPEADARGTASQLVDRCLAHLVHEVGAGRIESQFLHFGSEDLGPAFAAWGARRWRREFLRAPLARVAERLAGRLDPIDLRPLRASDAKAAGAVLHDSFAGTADAEMSQCYTSAEGCTTFIEGALGRTGCGAFEPTASFVASRGGSPIGMVIASRISPRTSHIVQISVAPSAQRLGVGRALLAASADGLVRRGFRELSLSVTVANPAARAWYRKLGFEPAREFSAWVRLRG